MNHSFAFLLLVSISSVTSQTCRNRPIIRIFESEGYGGDYIEEARTFLGIDDEKNLTSRGIQNSRLQYCAEGVWMAYSEADYGGSTYILASSKTTKDGLTSCFYENTGRRFRSLKIVGSHANFVENSLVVYPQMYNQGTPTTFYNATSRMDVAFDSFMLVGDSEVELFVGTGFAGLSVCIGPNNAYINTWGQYLEVNHLRGGNALYTYFGSISSILGNVQFNSFRYGCRNVNPMFVSGIES